MKVMTVFIWGPYRRSVMSRSTRGASALVATLALVVASLAALAFPTTASAAVRASAAAPVASDYQLTALPNIGTDGQYFGIAVNKGIAIGNKQSGFHDTNLPGWVSNHGVLSDLLAPTATWTTRVEAINASGLIIGEGYNADVLTATVALPMVWNASAPTSPSVLTVPAGAAQYGSGVAVNDAGQLIASYQFIDPQTQSHTTHTYFYASATTAPVQIGTGSGFTGQAIIIGMSNSGAILGNFPTSDGSSGYYLLPSPDATPAQSTLLDFTPRAISPNGTVAGSTGYADTAVTALRSPSGVETHPAGKVDPQSVNDSGSYTGFTIDANQRYTYVLVQDGTVTPLLSLVSGWLYADGSIDNDGDIVGAGGDPSGRDRRFILLHTHSAALTFSLAVSPSSPSPGQAATVTATISNGGNSTATGISASLSSTPSGHVSLGTPMPTSIASLAGGASATVTWSFTADQADTYALASALQWTDPTQGASTGSAQLSVVVAGSGIVVNSTGDGAQTSKAATDKTCDTDDAAAGLQCTLRAAIQLANELGSGSTQSITFDIPGGGVPTIAPATALPALTVPVILDGSTQTGGWVNISGTSESGDGLTVTGGGTTIRGFVLNGFATGTALVLTGAGHDVVVGNRIGTNAAGTAAVANQVGIAFTAPDTIIGALTSDGTLLCHGDCNVISGNTNSGILSGTTSVAGLTNPGTAPARSQIVGNVIGTDASGTTAIGNGYGIDVGTRPVFRWPTWSRSAARPAGLALRREISSAATRMEWFAEPRVSILLPFAATLWGRTGLAQPLSRTRTPASPLTAPTPSGDRTPRMET